MPEHAHENAALCYIPKRNVSIGLSRSWQSGFTQAEAKTAFERGLNLWSKVVDLKFTIHWQSDDEDINADHLRIDGGGRVVAWSQLPCPFRGSLQQRYDTAENWALGFNPSRGMPLPNVVAHEVGHALGLGHGPSNNIMHASIQSHMTDLGPWDRQEILRRYDPASKTKEEIPMGRFFACLTGILPELLSCLFESEAAAKDAGEKGPISWALEEVSKKVDSQSSKK